MSSRPPPDSAGQHRSIVTGRLIVGDQSQRKGRPVWYAVTCSYSDWSRRYKHQHPVHSHDAQGAFVVAAKNDAVAEMRGSGQPRFANVTANQVGTSSMQVNLPNDPGAGYRQI